MPSRRLGEKWISASPTRRGFFLPALAKADRKGGRCECAAAVAVMAECSSRIMDGEQVRRAVMRVAHEIVERSGGAERLALIGIHTRGVPLARRLAQMVGSIEGREPLCGTVDIALYRDDAGRRGGPATLYPTDIPFDVSDLTVVLVDDVLFTGRTIRAAMDALIDFGRPAVIQLAVLVDRGHRELPIRADYVGKNIPTSRDQRVVVRLVEMDGEDGVYLEEGDDGKS